jgi:hypothetical protein
MRSTSSDRSSGCSTAAVAPSMIPGLLQLLEAEAYARKVERSKWDFAVEIDGLRAVGVTTSDLRWLVCQGYLEHAVETTPAGSEARSFGKEASLTFSQRSCFVLTEGGADSAQRLVERANGGRGQNGASCDARNGAAQAVRPEWDPERRVLSVPGVGLAALHRRPPAAGPRRGPQAPAAGHDHPAEPQPAEPPDPLPRRRQRAGAMVGAGRVDCQQTANRLPTDCLLHALPQGAQYPKIARRGFGDVGTPDDPEQPDEMDVNTL